jgi:hypothetical protein
VDLAPVEPLHPATDVKVAAELLALQIATYRVEAELIGSDAIPALHETPTPSSPLVCAGSVAATARDC